MTTSSKPEPPSGQLPVAMSHPQLTTEDLTDLVSVRVVTKTGAEYVFPDMSLGVVRSILPESGRMSESQPTLVLLNLSAAVLSIPFHIIDDISVVGEESLWRSSVSTAEAK